MKLTVFNDLNTNQFISGDNHLLVDDCAQMERQMFTHFSHKPRRFRIIAGLRYVPWQRNQYARHYIFVVGLFVGHQIVAQQYAVTENDQRHD